MIASPFSGFRRLPPAPSMARLPSGVQVQSSFRLRCVRRGLSVVWAAASSLSAIHCWPVFMAVMAMPGSAQGPVSCT